MMRKILFLMMGSKVWAHFLVEMATAYPQPQIQYPLDSSIGFSKLRQEQTGQLNDVAPLQVHQEV